MSSLQQSPQYQAYVKKHGWQVYSVDGVTIFVRKFPFIGCYAKIQRPSHLPFLPILVPFLKKLRVRIVAIEPNQWEKQEEVHTYISGLSLWFRSNKTPFLPTKTILVDLTPREEKIFSRFTEAKRRAVRRAMNHHVVVTQSKNIGDLIHIKNQSAGLFGEITTIGIDALWNIFTQKHLSILLAHQKETPGKILGGILLLFWEDTAYYWIAGATKHGKKLFVPTLLVWEAIKLSRQKKKKYFDFIGVWDERIPKENTSWKGFTKFKEGFGGETTYYPLTSK